MYLNQSHIIYIIYILIACILSLHLDQIIFSVSPPMRLYKQAAFESSSRLGAVNLKVRELVSLSQLGEKWPTDTIIEHDIVVFN